MKNQSIRRRLLASTMIGSAAIAAAAALPIAAMMLTPSVAAAQSLTQGALEGTVEGVSGAPIAGATVTVTSNSQGFSRSFTTDENGRFRAVALPQGVYTVAITGDGFNPLSSNASVGLGGTTSYTFTVGTAAAAAADGVSNVDEIVVVGARAAVSAFDSTTTGLRVNVEELTAVTPIARNATALALLAPGTSQADSAFGNLAQISGSSAGENTFFVNGLNITDFVSFLGGASVPFEFYETYEVKTGGYSAEFGRGTGGVINATTKSGGNEWKFGITSYWEPMDLRETAPDTYLALNDFDETESWDVILEAGGPIIPDRLFVYGLYNERHRESFARNTSGIGFRDVNDTPVYGAKVDFIIADGHRLEGTYFSDKSESETEQLTYFAGTPTPNFRSDGVSNAEFGGDNYVFRYTGVFTDWLTASLSYGVNESLSRSFSEEDNNPVITDITGFDYNRDGILDVADGLSAQRGNWLVGSPSVNDDRREMFRADVDLYANFFGRHHFRGGVDYENLESSQTLSRSGSGFNYCRDANGDGVSEPISTAVNCTGSVTGGIEYRYQTAYTAANIPAGRTDLIGSPRRVRITVYDNSGTWESKQTAFYLQDSWEVTDRLTLNLGVRNETFENSNVDGEVFVDIDKQIAPRLGATYDVFGDKRAKLSAFYGRYFLPVAVNTNQRLAGAELFIRDTYNLNVNNGNRAIDANQDGIRDDNDQPIYLPTASAGFSTFADGTTKPIATQVDEDLDAMYVDEFILGYQQQIGDDWTAGITGTYRDLGRAIDDIAIDAAVLAYCDDNNITGCESVWTGFHQYVLTNPGEDLKITLSAADLANTSLGATARDTVVDLSAEDLGIPEPIREYKAVEVFLEKSFNGTWGGRASYVWSDSEGNYEGALKSDNGQVDPGLSQDFDQPGLVDGANGKLPGHREHSFKVYGNWQPIESLNIGANILVQSPRQFGCIGEHPTDDFAYQYAAASFFCDIDRDGDLESTPRGSVFESEWLKQIDFSVSYTLKNRWSIPGEGVTLRADIFNVFNFQSQLDFNEFGSLGDITGAGLAPAINLPSSPNPNFRKVTQFQSPRFVRLGASIKF